MPLNVAVQMDHVSTVSIAGDSTFALSLEAQRRGHKLFHYTPDRLSLRDGKVFARVEAMTVRDEKGNHFTLGEAGAHRSVGDGRGADAPGPALRHELHHHHPHPGAHPPEDAGGQRPGLGAQRPEKIFVTEFPDLMPPTLITRDPPEVAAFRKEHGDIIVKPLYGNGGAGVFHLKRGRPQPRLAARNVRADVPRAVHRPALPAGRAQGRQAHHPDRRRAGRRHQPRAGRGRGALQHACRRPRREDRADRARARDLRPHRPGAEGARLHLRRHRRDRRLSDRDQRHLADRHPRSQALRRRRHRRADLGRGRSRARPEDSARLPLQSTRYLHMFPYCSCVPEQSMLC